MWTDISGFVYYRDKVNITRGRADETSSIQPQTATLTINNRDGRFSPRNPVGPYYGIIGRNTPLRISRMWNGVRWYRFYGEVSEWPQTSDITGTDVYCRITASGIRRRLGQGTPPSYSALYRAITRLTDAPLIAYWPCEDGSNSTTMASAVPGVGPMSIAGAGASLAADSSFFGSAALPTMGTGSLSASVPSYPGSGAFTVRFLVGMPLAGIVTGSVIARVASSGTVTAWELYYGTASSGSLGLRGFDQTGANVADTGLVALTVNGRQFHIDINIAQSGANVTGTFSYYLITYPFTSGLIGPSATVNNATAGTCRSLAIAPGGALTGVTIGHVAVQDGSVNAGDIKTAIIGWNNMEYPRARMIRICQEESIPLEIIFGPLFVQDPPLVGFQTPDTILGIIDSCATTDMGIEYESRNQLGLGYRILKSLYNQTPKLTLDHSVHQLSAPLAPVDDDLHTRNTIIVSRIGGSTATATLAIGALSTQPPPSGVGPYQDTTSININLDSVLPDHAGWRLHLGTVTEARYPQISLNLRHPSITGNLDTMNGALAMDIGDRAVITNPPPGLPPDVISQLLQGYSESLGVFEHDMVLNCSPESPYEIGIVGDAVLGHIDTDGSTLVAPLSTTAVNPSVLTAAGFPLWTTAAGDFPFDIAVAGERMTVTSITGSSPGSPQTFIVTRSVNGVVKTHATGEDVRLWQPMVISL
jgi:hypothetical protein